MNIKKISSLEARFILELKGHGLFDQFEREVRFHPTRMWRIDFADRVNKVAVELEGGAFIRPVWCTTCNQKVMRHLKNGRTVPIFEGGAHNSSGFADDAEKYNALTVLGWRLLRYGNIAGIKCFVHDYSDLLASGKASRSDGTQLRMGLGA